MKKRMITTAIAVAAVSAVAAISVSAASVDDITAKLQGYGFTSSQISEAQSALGGVSAANLDIVSTQIDAAVSAAKAAGVNSPADITAAQLNTLKSNSAFVAAVDAAKTAAGVTTTLNADGTVSVKSASGETFTLTPTTGSTDTTTTEVSNSQTGSAAGLPVALVGGLFAVVAGAIAAAYAKFGRRFAAQH